MPLQTPLTDAQRANFISEVTAGIARHVVWPLRCIGAMLLIRAVGMMLSDGFPAIAGILLNLGAGCMLISFGEWHSESRSKSWLRLNITFLLALTALAAGSRINPLGPAMAMQGEVMLLLTSGLMLRQASDVWRMTLPAALSVLIVADPWSGPTQPAFLATFNLVCAVIGAYVIARYLEVYRIEEFRLRLRILDSEMIDPVTLLPTKAGFYKYLRAEQARAKRYPFPFSAFSIQVSNASGDVSFEGHNEVTAHWAQSLSRVRGAGDVVGYAGSGRFLMLLVGVDHDTAKQIAERIVNDVRSSPLLLSNGTLVNSEITISDLDPASLDEPAIKP